MFNGLYDVDWSSMHHAYGSAEEVPALLLALCSVDSQERSEALSRFYGAVHHQGGVYPCTTASLPFLFELADDTAAPDRAAIVKLLVSIGAEAVERCDEQYVGSVDYVGAARVMRQRAEVFVRFASDADADVRRAAVAGLALFVDDAEQAASLLRARLQAEPGTAERMSIVEAMATLALRQPTCSDDAMAWFDMLAADSAADAETRLAAIVHRAHCAPEQVSDDVVPTAIGLLRELTPATSTDRTWRDSRRPAAAASGAPPQVIAAFEDLDRQQRVYATTTDLLRTFHQALAARVSQRTALLAEQLRSRDPGARLDAIRMSAELMKSWRGDHTSLVTLVAEHLGATHHQLAAEAATAIEACYPIAEPARETLAAYVTAHGPDMWAAPQPHPRRAYQDVVRALARLSDMRAVPSVLAALDGDVDDWRAIQVAAALPKAAKQLVPRLCDHLHRVDVAQQWASMSTPAILSALAKLGDSAALPSVTEILLAAMRYEQWEITSSALDTLGAFGSAAAPALTTIRSLTAAPNIHVRSAAAALWATRGDCDEVMPLLYDLLEDGVTRAADILGEIGPPAAGALPLLRGQLTHSYEWVRVHCAAALWEISGEAEASTVLNTLLPAWTYNPATANHVVACLNRMGHAAKPALPHLRSQLALPRRSGRFTSIDNDEELQRVSRAIIERLA